MAIDIVNADIERYLHSLQQRHDDQVLLAMEGEAKEHRFPIVGRVVGVTLEVLARTAGARRVFELGSGYGYSAYWFARAVGDGGEVHCSDGDPDNERKAADYLGRAGLWSRVSFHVGDALAALAGFAGEFDIIYNDIDKEGYPDAWRAARERVRVGGLYLCDNVLWYGRVSERHRGDDPRPDWTEAIVEHNHLIASDDTYLSTIMPIRDGMMVALRLA